MQDTLNIGLDTFGSEIFFAYLVLSFLGAVGALLRLATDQNFGGVKLPRINYKTRVLELGFLLNLFMGAVAGFIVATGFDTILIPLDFTWLLPRTIMALAAGYMSAYGFRWFARLRFKGAGIPNFNLKAPKQGELVSFTKTMEFEILRFYPFLREVTINEDKLARKIFVLVQGYERISADDVDEIKQFILSKPVWGVDVVVKKPDEKRIKLAGKLNVTSADARKDIEEKLRVLFNEHVNGLPAGMPVALTPFIKIATNISGVKDFYNMVTEPAVNAENVIEIGSEEVPVLERLEFK